MKPEIYIKLRMQYKVLMLRSDNYWDDYSQASLDQCRDFIKRHEIKNYKIIRTYTSGEIVESSK